MSVLFRASPAFVVALLFLTPPVALAQEPGGLQVPLVEVSGGYMFMRDLSDRPGADGTNFPAGWYFSGAVNPYRWFGVVGEASGSHKNHFDVNFDGLRFSNDAQVYTFMGGPRFFRKVGRVVPFAQVLAGVAHMRLKTRFSDPFIPGVDSIEDSVTDFALQPGGGVTVLLTEHVGARVAADYRTIIDFDEDGNDYTNEVRVIAGFTLHWGGR